MLCIYLQYCAALASGTAEQINNCVTKNPKTLSKFEKNVNGGKRQFQDVLLNVKNNLLSFCMFVVLLSGPKSNNRSPITRRKQSACNNYFAKYLLLWGKIRITNLAGISFTNMLLMILPYTSFKLTRLKINETN